MEWRASWESVREVTLGWRMRGGAGLKGADGLPHRRCLPATLGGAPAVSGGQLGGGGRLILSVSPRTLLRPRLLCTARSLVSRTGLERQMDITG